jgi:hypothetical protein
MRVFWRVALAVGAATGVAAAQSPPPAVESVAAQQHRFDQPEATRPLPPNYSAWADRPFAVDASLGIATPVGLAGVWLDGSPTRWLSLSVGAGTNLSGLQLAGMVRFRFTPNRRDSPFIGAGYSRGPFSQSRWTRYGMMSIPDGAYDQMLADHSPTPGRHWDLAHWVNLEFGGELRRSSGFDARAFGGLGMLANPRDNTVGTPASETSPAPRKVVPMVIYFGAAFGFSL